MEMREIWDEFRWEEFMREQDRKVDRYMELFYRYRNDPKRDEIIAREMGWTWLLQEDHRARLADLSPATDDELDEGDEWKTRIEPSDDLPAAFSGFELLPVYQNAMNFSLRAFHYVDRLPEHRRADSAVVDFLSNAIVAASKIAGGT